MYHVENYYYVLYICIYETYYLLNVIFEIYIPPTT